MKKSKVVWITKTGLKLRMHEIDDRHLLNIIRLLERRRLRDVSLGYAVLSGLRGEMAQFYAERDIERLEDAYDTTIAMFSEEARQRGLAVNSPE